MIIAVWFTIVAIIFLFGMGLVALTFRHWYLEAKAKRKELEGNQVEQGV